MKKGFMPLKRSYWVIVLVCQFLVGRSQQKVEELKVGEKMPNINLGRIFNYSKNSAYLSEYQNKLLILYFWDIYCKGCIADFPKLESIQNRFSEQVHVFLITSNSQEQIETAFKKRGKVFPNLPCIVEDTLMSKYFPHKYSSHIVWIDGNGIVQLRGISENMTDAKIQAAIDGKAFSFINDNVTYDQNRPLFSMSMSITEPQYVSTFSSFNDKIADPYGEMAIVIDSSAKTIRQTHLNRNVLITYKIAFNEELEKEWIQVLNRRNDLMYDQSIVLNLKDSSFLAPNYINEKERNDVWMRTNLFCYEQVVPLSIKEARHKFMQEDLNRYFGQLYNIEARIESRKTKCFILVNRESAIRESKKGRFKVYRKSEFQNLVTSMTNNFAFWEFHDALVIDKTSSPRESIDGVPKTLKNFEEFTQFMKKHGIEVIESYRNVKYLVISDKSTAKVIVKTNLN